MTWRNWIERASETLRKAQVDDARVHAEYLAAHALGLKRKSDVRPFLDREVGSHAEEQFRSILDRRERREPLQYILGEWEFFGLPIKIDPSALIPRPETEILVEEALREAARVPGPLFMLDIGTGSGAIALALASKLPDAKILGIDSSIAAIALAEENKKHLHLTNVTFEPVDIQWTEWTNLVGTFDLIVSNPPYISREEFDLLEPELRLYEPRQALTDEATGLTFYERIATLAPNMLAFGGRLLVELGYGSAESVSGIMRAHRLEVLRIVNDLAGIPRVLVAAVKQA